MYLLKRIVPLTIEPCYCWFTFHHVSIKTQMDLETQAVRNHSHSTMYLLKLHWQARMPHPRRNSHSTMYLLKRVDGSYRYVVKNKFTFHHVSIKTTSQYINEQLLNSFTFHHVSIKTTSSTLYFNAPATFTFHHVSIKTVYGSFGDGLPIEFTFHHVSIKTWADIFAKRNTFLIHIPPCIY